MSLDRDYIEKVTGFLTNKPFRDDAGSLEYIGGIVGGEEPSRYSRSPDLWNAFFTGMGIRAFFSSFDLPPEKSLSRFIRAVFDRPFCLDLTVTSPYKAAAYGVLADLSGKLVVSDRVHHLRSLNHIIPDFKTGEFFVDSTDGMGMALALGKRKDLDGSQVLLVGAGGAAASIGYELARAGAEIFIANIIESDALKLAENLLKHARPGRKISAGDWSSIRKEAPQSDIIVSAITVSKPLEEKDMDLLRPDCLLADTRYGRMAEFAAAAEKTGRSCVDGREMLFGQFYYAAEKVGGLLGFDADMVKNILKTIECSFLTS